MIVVVISQILICACPSAHDVFLLFIIFFGSNWKPKHVTLGLFESIKTIGQVLVKIFIELLDAYCLRNNIIIYV